MNRTAPTEPVSGLSLKLMRTAKRVRANRIAAAMGVSAKRVYNLEREQFPSDEMVRRYVVALDTCAASTTSAVA